MSEKPIVVNDSPIPDQVMTTIRQIGAMGIAYLVGAGVLDQVTGDRIFSLVPLVAPLLWSLYTTTRKHTKMRTMANETPDYVAQVK